MLPTKLAVSLAESAGINELFDDVHQWSEYLGRFQRLSLVADYDTAVKALVPYLSGALEANHKTCLLLIYDITRSDVLSLAMESLIHVAHSGRSERDRMTASAMLNELFGDKDVVRDTVLTDKLVMNLVGKAE